MTPLVGARVPSSRAPLTVLALLALLLLLGGVAGAWFALDGRASRARNVAQAELDEVGGESRGEAREDPLEETTPVQIVTPVGVEAPPPPRVRIVSEPEGAAVLLDDVLIGTTPLEVERPLGEERRRIRLRLRGHHARVIEVPSVGSDTLTVRLREITTESEMEPTTTMTVAEMTTSARMTEMNSEMTPAMMTPVVRTEVVDPWADE